MKICRTIQISLLVLIGAVLVFKGPSNFKDSNEVWALNKEATGLFKGQPRYYEHSSRAYFRFYVSPGRRYYYGRPYYYYNYDRYYNYRSEVYLTVREDPKSGERVRNVHIDNYRVNLNPPSKRGNRGTFTYRLRQGSHLIEWSLEKPHGKVEDFQRQFYVDGNRRSVNLVIDGDEFYRN